MQEDKKLRDYVSNSDALLASALMSERRFAEAVPILQQFLKDWKPPQEVGPSAVRFISSESALIAGAAARFPVAAGSGSADGQSRRRGR